MNEAALRGAGAAWAPWSNCFHSFIIKHIKNICNILYLGVDKTYETGNIVSVRDLREGRNEDE